MSHSAIEDHAERDLVTVAVGDRPLRAFASTSRRPLGSRPRMAPVVAWESENGCHTLAQPKSGTSRLQDAVFYARGSDHRPISGWPATYVANRPHGPVRTAFTPNSPERAT